MIIRFLLADSSRASLGGTGRAPALPSESANQAHGVVARAARAHRR